MQRYFIQAEQWVDHEAVLTGDDAHHIVNVMRLRAGDSIQICDGAGRVAVAKLTAIDKQRVTAAILEPLSGSGEPAVRVTIAQSLPKGDKMEMVIQKGTEIGAYCFRPFVSERTVVQYDGKKEAKRLERWGKVAKEAAEQAHRSRIPQVDSPLSWAELLKSAHTTDAAFFCYEKPGGAAFPAALRQAIEARGSTDGMSVMIVIGPEGGFTEREVREAEAAGCVPVGLGPRILRTETAGLVALACVLYEAGEMGG